MFFLLVVMKVPVIGMIYLLYWAAKNEPENGADQTPTRDGGRNHSAAVRSRVAPGVTRMAAVRSRWPAPGPYPGPVHEGRSRQPAVVVARSRETARSAETVRK